MSPSDVTAAVARLRAGDVVAFPTETVYGLGADARNPDAVRRIYALKGRPPGHPLIVHLASATMLGDWAARVPPAARALAKRFWPGPLTLVLPRASGVPDAVTGGQESVGLRVPSHPIAHALLAAFGGGVAAPSANRYGRVSPTRAAHVRDEFGDAVPCVLDGGDCEVGLESTIVACLDDGPPLLLRPGHVSHAALEAVAGPVRRAAAGEGPRAPGTTRSHYAPATPVRLVATGELASADAATAVLARRAAPATYAGPRWIDAGNDAARYGHDLYANLRQLDAAGARRILIESVPTDTAWDAVRDRVQRAAAREDTGDAGVEGP
jgi:L-threonylcarbamoyladenylate synthase